MARGSILPLLALAACGHTARVPPPGVPEANTVEAVTEAHKPSLDALRGQLRRRHGAASYFPAGDLEQLAKAREQLLDGLVAFAESLAKVSPSALRSTALRRVLTESRLLCDGTMWPCNSTVGLCGGPVLELGVVNKDKAFTSWPLARAWLVPTCRNYKGLHCMANPFTYIILLPLAVLDIPGFFIGSWWWAGQTTQRNLLLGPVHASRKDLVLRKLLRLLQAPRSKNRQ